MQFRCREEGQHGRQIRSGVTVSAADFCRSRVRGVQGIFLAVELQRNRRRRATATCSNGLQSAHGTKKLLLIQVCAAFIFVFSGRFGGVGDRQRAERRSSAEDPMGLDVILFSGGVCVLLCRDTRPFCIHLDGSVFVRFPYGEYMQRIL